jgi:DNA-binding CsgD family transcriptional regulator
MSSRGERISLTSQRTHGTLERNAEVVRRIRAGERSTDVAKDLGVSRQRVEQIVRRMENRARSATQAALIRGDMVRPDACSACGAAGEIEAHHDDYTKPTDIEWLCRACHAKADSARRRAAAKRRVPDGISAMSVAEAAAQCGVSPSRFRGIAAASSVRAMKVSGQYFFRGPDVDRIVREHRAREDRKTQCKRGHHLTPDNIRVTADGKRRCLACLAFQQTRGRARGSLTIYLVKQTFQSVGLALAKRTTASVVHKDGDVTIKAGRCIRTNKWHITLFVADVEVRFAPVIRGQDLLTTLRRATRTAAMLATREAFGSAA